MINNHDAGPFVYRLGRWSLFLALFTATIALLTLAGWEWDLALLKRPLPGLVAMNPLTALGFLLSSLALLSRMSGESKDWQKNSAKLLAAIVLLIGLACFAGYFVPALSGTDRLLFHNRLIKDEAGSLSNRMAVNSALCFMLLSPSLMFSEAASQRRVRYADLLVMVVGILSLLSLIGYFYQVKEFYGILRNFPMAIHTALCFFCLALA